MGLEKRKKLDASISSQHGADKMEHEKILELERKISKLEDSLKVAKRKADVYRLELRTLHKKHRKATEELEAVEKTFFEGLETYAYPRGDHGRIGPKEMGILYPQEDFGYRNDLRVGDEFMTFWEARIKEPDFDASTCVDDGDGNMKYVIKEDHEELNQLRKSYGDEVYKVVCNVHLQVMEWGTGSVLWDYEEGRKASVMDVLEHCSLEIQPN